MINVAIVGAGNCASALVQGVHYYRQVKEGHKIPGVMHPVLGGYSIGDINFVAAFDVTTDKVGLDLSNAVFAHPNNAYEFEVPLPYLDCEVYRGPLLDGIGDYHKELSVVHAEQQYDEDYWVNRVATTLVDKKVDVLVNFLPVGSQLATEFYMVCALNAGCHVVNCIPVFIASDEVWAYEFKSNDLVIIGDDIKSQVGATIVHRVLTSLFKDRGVDLKETYQLNFGGNMDFYNMLQRDRLESKKISKTQAVTSMTGKQLPEDSVHVGPSDHVPFLTDQKYCHILMNGIAFGGVPLKLELKLEVWDSNNSAGVVIDAIRCAMLAGDRGQYGSHELSSAYFMKSPPVQIKDARAKDLLEGWIEDSEFEVDFDN